MIKEAFLSGFMAKRKEKKREAAAQGFVGSVNSVHAASSHHPVPHKTTRQWVDEFNNTPEVHGHADGWNFHTDRFNTWLGSEEGKKWNDTQAKKYEKANKDKD